MIAALKKDFLEYYGLTGTNYQVSFYSGSGVIVEHDKKKRLVGNVRRLGSNNAVVRTKSKRLSFKQKMT